MLVDRLWPRGVRKPEARVDEWARELAPSDELRRWFAHDPARFEAFASRYREELATHEEALDGLREPVTLVFGARDVTYNNAAVLAGLLGGPEDG